MRAARSFSSGQRRQPCPQVSATAAPTPTATSIFIRKQHPIADARRIGKFSRPVAGGLPNSTRAPISLGWRGRPFSHNHPATALPFRNSRRVPNAGPTFILWPQPVIPQTNQAVSISVQQWTRTALPPFAQYRVNPSPTFKHDKLTLQTNASGQATSRGKAERDVQSLLSLPG